MAEPDDLNDYVRRRRPFFVHFFGADGTGKTPQARMLVRYLRRNGVATKLVRIRSGRTFASILYSILRRVSPHLVILGGDGRVIRVLMVKGRLGGRIWGLIEFVSMLPWLARGVFIPLRSGKTVVAERYIIDAITTIAYLVDDSSWMTSSVAKIMFRFVPKNTQFIHLDASYDTLSKRKGSFPDPRNYIEFQRRSYLSFARATGAITIDTSEHSIADTHRIIRKFVTR